MVPDKADEPAGKDIPQDPVDRLAQERFGIAHLAPLQRFVIANILEAEEPDREEPDREDCTMRQIVLFPTGFGKSVCFQLPALMLKGLTVVLYPLLALMNDQKRRLEESGLSCVLFRGELSQDEWERQRQALASGSARIVIANPEILASQKLRALLSRFPISHLVIDEAHCIAEWGETFRPAYRAVGEIADLLAPRIVSAFTATAGPAIIDSIAQHLFQGNPFRLVNSEADRPNLRYMVVHALSPARALRQLLTVCPKPAIVFERSRPGTRYIAEQLRNAGFPETRFYHAGLSRAERNALEAWFQSSNDGVLASTNAYGMGVDKKNIRTVIHTGLPDSAEAYIQEAGRGGRDGKPALAIFIHDLGNPLDSEKPESPTTTPLAIRRERFAPYPLIEGCRREFLLKQMGEEATPACGTCDNCALPGASSTLSDMLKRSEGFSEALSFFSANRRRLQIEQCIKYLGPAGRGLCPRGGVLAHWTEIERKELVQALLKLGIISTIRKGPWKNAIDVHIP